MGAPLNNQFWKNRTKHGRDKIFSHPDILAEEANRYFEFCDQNPLIEVDFKGKDADEVHIPKMRAYTWSGLQVFLGIYDLRDYKSKEGYEDFKHVITHIEQIMRTQKFEGAAAGFLNPNIIARDLGLVDHKDMTTAGDKLPEPAKMPDLTVNIVMPKELD